MKLGIELAALQQPLAKALRGAAQLGFDAVEIDARGELTPAELSQTGLRHVRKLLADHNLRVSVLGFRTRRGYGDEDQLDRRVEATKRAMEMAYGLGAVAVVNHIGRAPPADSPQFRLMTEVLSDLGSYGHRVGVTLAAETGTESGPELARLLAALPEGSVGVDFNPGKLVLGGFSASEALEVLAPAIVHVHLADAVPGPFPGMGELRPIGRGQTDLPNLLGILDQRGYRGYFTLQRWPSSDPIKEIGEAVERLRRM